MAEMNGWAYVIAAYVITWITLAGYMWYLHRRKRQAAARFHRARDAAAMPAGGSRHEPSHGRDSGMEPSRSGNSGTTPSRAGDSTPGPSPGEKSIHEPLQRDDSEALS